MKKQRLIKAFILDRYKLPKTLCKMYVMKVKGKGKRKKKVNKLKSYL